MKNRNLSEWGVALSVIACSIVLFLALAFALTGTTISTPNRTVRANFPDITGITIGSKVKFAGASAGKVSDIRVLTLEERRQDGNQDNAVEITLALDDDVPELPSDTIPSISSDTLLSDKFVLLSGGSASAPVLQEETTVLQGIPPVTFDRLARNVDSAVDGLGKLMGGTEGKASDVFERLHGLLTDTQGLISEAKPAVADVRSLTSDARQLIADNKAQINESITSLNQTAKAFDQLAANGNKLIVNNEKKLTATFADLKVTSENLKVTSTYTKILIRSLTQRPSQLLWGNSRPPALPSEQEIIRATKPIPTN